MANKKWSKEDVLQYAQELRSPFEEQRIERRQGLLSATQKLRANMPRLRK